MVDPARLENLIKGRRSVRRYTGKDLPTSLIDNLLAVSCYAPTGINNQSVLFTVIKEGRVMDTFRQEVMRRLAEEQSAGKLADGIVGHYLGAAVKSWRDGGKDIIFRGAPHLLVTSAPQDSPCPVQDSHIALTTFQLLAHAHGVGTVWDGMLMMAVAVCPDLISRLGIPGDHLLGYAMAFGEPAVEYHRVVQRGPALVNVVKG
jgi:nitroreductase